MSAGNMGAATGWQPIETAPKDGTSILLHFPGEAEEVRGGRWVTRETYENGVLVFRQEGWEMSDRAEIRGENEPENWCPVAAPPPRQPSLNDPLGEPGA